MREPRWEKKKSYTRGIGRRDDSVGVLNAELNLTDLRETSNRSVSGVKLERVKTHERDVRKHEKAN